VFLMHNIYYYMYIMNTSGCGGVGEEHIDVGVAFAFMMLG